MNITVQNEMHCEISSMYKRVEIGPWTKTQRQKEHSWLENNIQEKEIRIHKFNKNLKKKKCLIKTKKKLNNNKTMFDKKI